LKETRSLRPPQRGVGLRELNLSKTNPRVTLLIHLRFVLRPLSRTRFIFLTLTRLVVVIKFVNFRFTLFTPLYATIRTDDVSTLAKDLLGVSLVPEITMQSVPDATSPPSIDQEVPSVFHPIPFRFSFDPPSDPASVSAFVKAYPHFPRYRMWSSWDRLTVVPTSGLAGSEEDDDSDFGWDFSGLSDPSAMRDFMSACDYCLSSCSDDGHSLGDEGCDPSHECFHIDQGDHGEDNHLGMPQDDNALVPASRVDIPRELAVVPVPAGGGGSGHTARAIPRDAGQARRRSRVACAASTRHRAGVGRPRTSRRSASSGPRRPAPYH
jgi:hypothetical protein